ncbi:small subunit ribosomal protein S12e [Nematocida major]|uniref:small subunit ribosomal protein S12e n=1 Tax=Nematocida major TaxID=1912982 RepID=UPI0020084D12|nr:small subunit ribosomal protein S12e [Nematocida major]KAH9387476.1 small subunit ribosomal protein S12e [Nematocida major]
MESLNVQQGEMGMSTTESIERMLTSSLRASGVVKGFRQVTKSIIGGRSHLVIMSKEITEKKMKAIIEGLVKEHNLPILMVNNHNDLARYAGICKTDETGKIVKEAKCAVASIENFGDDLEGKDALFSMLGLSK